MTRRPQVRPLWQNTKAEITAQALWDYGWYIGWGVATVAVLFGAIR